MSYYDVYHCQGCPVSKWCGTAVSCFRLCNSYDSNRKRKNPLYPYEVKVGATVKLFSDKSNAFSYAYEEQRKIIEHLMQKIKTTHKIVVEPEVEE